MKKAIHFLGKEFTFQYIFESAEKFAGYLQSIGIKKGDRVAIMLPNTPQAVIGFYASIDGRWSGSRDKSPIYRTRT